MSELDRFTYHRYRNWDGETYGIAYQEFDNSLFIPIPKCASSTLRARLNGPKIYEIENVDVLKNINKFKFTFVRNPYSRILSCWSGKIKNKFGSAITNMDGYHYDMTFEEFVKKVYETPNYLCEQHFAPITTIVGDIEFDFFGKIETFETDYNTLSNLIDVPKVSINHAVTKVGEKYKEYFNQELYEMVNDKYDADFKRFNYKKEYE